MHTYTSVCAEEVGCKDVFPTMFPCPSLKATLIKDLLVFSKNFKKHPF